MKKLDETGSVGRLQLDIGKQLKDRIDKLDKRFVESGTNYYRAALIRHLIDLGLQCYEQEK